MTVARASRSTLGPNRSLANGRERPEAVVRFAIRPSWTQLKKALQETAFTTIRALKSRFTVVKKSSGEFSFIVEKAEIGDRHCSAMLRFLKPAQVFASAWEVAVSDWQNLLDFQLPEHGGINEAFVKPWGRGLKVSFTDSKTRLLRWGFIAQSVEVTAQE